MAICAGVLLAGALAWAPGVRAGSDVATGKGGLSAKAHVDLKVTIPRTLSLKLIAHPTSLEVTADDIARGFVEVRGPLVRILSNFRDGYRLRAELSGSAFSRALIEGLPAPVMTQEGHASVAMPSMVGAKAPPPYALGYRLHLAASATPGHYPWPVRLALEQP